ncbi:uncharacterized protein isoform X1 [Rhodnius prolixus]|uniref:Putative cuticle protein lpcp-23 lygus hesperus n=1 Tax=Rhodnius prolixus TaxID=13249 RepID=A0A4P6D9M4_RHOPR
MKTFVVVALMIAVVCAYPEEEAAKNKRGVFGGYGFGHAPLFAAPAPLLHAPLLAPAPVFTKTVLPAPVVTKTLVSAPVFTKTVLPAAPLVAAPLGLGHGHFGLGHGHFGLGHGLGGHYW